MSSFPSQFTVVFGKQEIYACEMSQQMLNKRWGRYAAAVGERAAEKLVSRRRGPRVTNDSWSQAFLFFCSDHEKVTKNDKLCMPKHN